jgi:hypothetical protein
MTARICTVLTAALALLAPGMARADTTYKIQPIIKSGDQVGDFVFGPAKNQFIVVGLNDAGQLLFLGQNDAARSGILVQYASGTFTPIAAPGKDRPGGQWPSNIGFWRPMTMNQRGNVAFNPGTGEPPRSLGVFSWDAQTRQVTPVALAGMPTGNSLTFAEGGGSGIAINSSNEIAFSQPVKDSSGKLLGSGSFFLGRDGVLRVVALPAQELPGGGTVNATYIESLNDAGVVGFVAQPQRNGRLRAYLWEQGVITAVGTEVAGGGTIAGDVYPIWVNNKNRSVLFAAQRTNGGPWGLYRWNDGQLIPVLVRGQALPGGGTLRELQDVFSNSVNDAGQHAFPLTLTEGGTTRRGAYLLDPDGKLSLILKEGMVTELGTITHLGTPVGTGGSVGGIGLNSQGQVALPVRIDNGPPTLVVLTPTAP